MDSECLEAASESIRASVQQQFISLWSVLKSFILRGLLFEAEIVSDEGRVEQPQGRTEGGISGYHGFLSQCMCDGG